MGHEPDYSDEVAREIDDEVRRIIEEGHELALKGLREHMDDLHKISQILIERETIDKDQFIRLLAGETELQVFEPETEPEPEPEAKPKARAPRQPRPFPLPGSARPATERWRKNPRKPDAADRRALPPERDGA
jgi:cell division protease FtsH